MLLGNSLCSEVTEAICSGLSTAASCPDGHDEPRGSRIVLNGALTLSSERIRVSESVLLHQTHRSESGTDGLARTNLRFSREVVRKRGWRPSGTGNQAEISNGPSRWHLDVL
jgi:hypothetical protein